MKIQNIKIQYLFNSGFILQTDKSVLVFDYYKGAVDFNNLGFEDKKIYVFSSHGHKDHFNEEIFNWSNIRPDIKYILSSDIKVEINDQNSKQENITYISPYQEIEIDDAKIKAFGSTDLGVSFFVNIDNINIFHAGDLNWWNWPGDVPTDAINMEESFKEEIKKIKVQTLDNPIDIAFFPVDPRLEHNYYTGGEHFIKEIIPKHFLPMHFGINYKSTKDFAFKMSQFTTKIIEISCKGQEFII